MVVLLEDMTEEDKNFPVHQSTLTEITTYRDNRDIEI